MRKISKKIVVGAAATAIVAAGAGVAFAYWTTGGSGSGSATTGSVSGISVVQDSTVSGLYPGGPAQALSGHFSSSNDADVHIGAVTAQVHAFSAQADTSKPACTAADFQIGGSSGPYTVVKGSGTTWSGLTVSLSNAATNQDNCQNVSITIDYTATAAS